MWHLIQSEFIRFRRLAIGFAVAHLLILKGISAFSDFFAPSSAKVMGGVLLYALTGLIFGLYQMGSYKRLNQWTYLIHRPIAPGKIFLALATAATLWFVVVLSIPQLLMTLYLDWMTPLWVDQRQFLLALFLLGTVLCFYLAGCFISLNPSRAAFLVLVLPTFFLTRKAVGLWVFLPQMLVLAWLTYLVLKNFKPDLQTQPRHPLTVTAAALPLQYAFFGILVMGSTLTYQTSVVIQEEGWGGYATHAWNDHFPEGTFLHMGYLRPQLALAHGLQELDSERGRHLLKQTELARVHSVSPSFGQFPVRGQLMFNDTSLSMRDDESSKIWTFRHDRMLFQGQDLTTGQVGGWLGLDGMSSEQDQSGRELQPFESVPLVAANRFLLTPQKLYEFDARRGTLGLRFSLTGREVFRGPFEREGTIVTALSNEKLYFFDGRDLEKDLDPIVPTASLAFPDDVENLESVQVAELIDGYLISMVFGSRHEAGFGEARQVMVEVAVDGSQDLVTERELRLGWPDLYRFQSFMISPLLKTTHDLIWGAISPHDRNRVTVKDIVQRELPRSVLGWAFLLALLSAAAAAFLTRSRELSPAGRWAWIAAAFLLGFPACLSLIFLTRRLELVHAPALEKTRLSLTAEAAV